MIQGFNLTVVTQEFQRSLSGTSESGSDSGLLEGASSPLKKKFQKIKGENRELKKRNAELTEENLGLRHEVSEWQESYAFLQQQIHGLTKKYIEVCQHCQELEKEIEVSSDPKMVSLRLGRESEKVKEMEIEMKQWKDKADHYEKKIQELEQQKEEVVRMAVSQEYFLPDTCVKGMYIFWNGGGSTSIMPCIKLHYYSLSGLGLVCQILHIWVLRLASIHYFLVMFMQSPSWDSLLTFHFVEVKVKES